MGKLRSAMRATPFLGMGFVLGAVLQLPLLLAIGSIRTAVIQGVLLVLGALWATAGFALRRAHKRKMIEYLKSEGFDLSQVKDDQARVR